MIQFKKLFLNSTFALLILFGSVQITSAALSDSCATPPGSTTERVGFTQPQCPDGLGYPSINSFKNVLRFTGLPTRDESDFSLVKLGTSTGGEANYGNEVELTDTQSTAKFFNYIHNGGNPECNTNSTTILNRENCTENTIAKNVRIKIVSGLELSNGEVVSEVSSTGQHTIIFEISSDNTYPRTRRDSIVINTPANRQIRLNNDPSNFTNRVCENPQPRTPCARFTPNQFSPEDLVSDGVILSSSFAASGASNGDFYASLGYKLLQTGVIELVPVPACRIVQIIDPEDIEVDWETQTADFNIRVGADLTPDQILSRLNLNIFDGTVDATFFNLTGDLLYSNIERNAYFGFGNPTYRFTVSDIDPNDRFEISLPGYEEVPLCSDTFTFPQRPIPGVPACTNMELENLSTDWTTRTAEFELKVVADLTPAEIQTRLNSNPNGPNDPFTAEFGAMNFGRADRQGGVFGGLLGTPSYRFTVSNIDNDDKFSVRLPGFYEDTACSVEYTFSQNPGNGCQSFAFDDASFRENSRLVGSTIDYTASPTSFNTTTNISCASTSESGRYRVNPNGLAGSTTGSINLGFFERGDSITCTAETGNTACTDTYTRPELENSCQSFTISPVKFTPGETETFTINNITPADFRANVVWKVIDEDGTVVTSSTARPITEPFTTGILTETQRVTVELVDQSLNPTGNCRGEALPEIPEDTTCKDLSITPRQFTPGQTGSFRVENVRPVGFDSPLTWEVKNPSGETIQTGSTAINVDFLPADPLQANYTVSVKVTDTDLDPDNNCVDVISSQEQTIVCQDLQITQTSLSEGINSLNLTGILPSGFNQPVTWTTTQNGIPRSEQLPITSPYSTEPLTNGATVSVQVANSAFDPNGVCTDSRTLTTTPPEEIVCEDLILTDQDGDKLNDGDNLPGDRVTTLQFRTVPPQFKGDVRVTGRNLTVLEDDDKYNVFNVNRSSELKFSVPNSPNCQIELDGDDDDFDIDLIKEISARNEFPQRPGRNYIFTDLGRSIFYRLTLDTNNTDFPQGTTFRVYDEIEDGIPGVRNGDRGGRFGELNLDNGTRFNQNFRLRSDINQVEYQGSIDWPERRAQCQNFEGDCSVRYRNEAEVVIEVPGEPVDGIDNPEPEVIVVESNPTYAIVVCPFIITRGFGDIYLEKQFSTGVNIQACGRVNSQSPVFTPVPKAQQLIVSTGSNDNLNLPSHGICKALQGSDSARKEALDQLKEAGLDKYYSSEELNNFSSSVCQVAIVNAERWEKEKIAAKLKSNFARVAPESKASGSTTLNAISDSTISSRTKIAAYRGLTLGSKGNTVTINGNSARTFVVYGDLIINSNVTYAKNSSGTVAFIVIGGDIKIKPGVTQINGVYATVDNDATITWNSSDETSEEPIIIRGSAYGNIDPLFSGVNSAGNLAADRGGVTVIFDGRITRKIPPGLQDVIKFNQFQTATQSNFFSQSE